MYTVIFDLEWNVPGRKKVPAKLKEALPFEIIEIGAVKLDAAMREVDRFSCLVRPQVYTTLDRHVAKVTNRYPESLKKGLSFPEAAKRFFAWCQERPDPIVEDTAGEGPAVEVQAGGEPVDVPYLFATWSDMDTGPLRDNLRYHGMEDRLPTKCLNVQKLYSVVMGESKSQQRSVSHALEQLGIAQEEALHRAVNDAVYTGKILRALTLRMTAEENAATSEAGVQESATPETAKAPSNGIRSLRDGLNRLPKRALARRLYDMAYDPNLTYKKRIDLTPDRTAATVVQEGEETPAHCPDCDQALRTLRPWYAVKETSRRIRRAARFACPQHGDVVGTMKLRVGPESMWYGHVEYQLHRPLEL